MSSLILNKLRNLQKSTHIISSAINIKRRGIAKSVTSIKAKRPERESFHERAAKLAAQSKQETDISDTDEFEGLSKDEFNLFITIWFKRYLIDNVGNAHNFDIILDSDEFSEEEKDNLIFNLDDFKKAAEYYLKESEKMAPRLNEEQRDMYGHVMMGVVYGNIEDWKKHLERTIKEEGTLKPKTNKFGNLK